MEPDDLTPAENAIRRSAGKHFDARQNLSFATKELRSRVRRGHREGLSIRRLAALANVSPTTIVAWLKP